MNILTKHIRRLNASVLLTVVSIGFLVPIAYLMFYSILGYNGYIDFADKEKSGAIFLKNLKPVINSVFDYCNQSDNSAAINSTKAKVNDSFNELMKTTKDLEEELSLSQSHFKEIKKNNIHPVTLFEKWKSSSESSNSREECEGLILDLIALNNYVGDISNLILDPDLDSYYLMDVALLAMPQLTKRVNDFRNYIKFTIADSTLTFEGRIYLSVFQSGFRDGDIARVNGSIQTALEQDASFYGVCPNLAKNINSILPEFNRSAEHLLKLNENSSTIDGELNLAQIDQEAENTLKSSSLLWDSSLNELIRLLDIRMDDYRSGRLNTIIIAAFFVLISYLMLYFVAKRISRIIKSTTMFMLSISEGKLSEAAQKVKHLREKVYS
jgi:methyl-accepting chemotaxis protein